jgi:dolichyl-phosphate-mannose-protein mannosyltransferase
MSKMKRRAAAAAPRAIIQTPAPNVHSNVSAVPWWIALACLTVLAYLFLWWPLERTPVHMEVNYNEGWNAYNQQRAASGEALYGKPPLYYYTNYPPVSFHLIGLAGNLTGDFNLTGRWISLLSLFAVGALSGLTVWRLTGLKLSGLYTALALVILVVSLREDRIGMNDPHLLGMAFGALGLYWLVLDPRSIRWLCLSGAAFAVSVFTKQSLVAIPAAIAIYLFLDFRRAFWTWLAAAAAACVLLLGLTFALDGRHFLEHMALPRVSDFPHFGDHISSYLLLSWMAIAGAAAWCFLAGVRGILRLLIWMLVATHAVALWFATGAGVVAGLLLLTAFLPAAYRCATLGYPAELVRSSLRPAFEAEFTGLVRYIQTRNGDALCEALLVCYEAGKPEVYDPYLVTQLLSTGKLPESDILRLLDERHFAVVQTDIVNGVDPLAVSGHDRFSPAFMRHLFDNYRMVWRTGHFAAFVPKP